MASSKTEHYIDIVQGLTPELEKLADDIEETEQFPTRAYELLAENDLLRLTLPTAHGGEGMSLIDYFPVLQQVARIHGTLRMFVHGQNGMWRPPLTSKHWRRCSSCTGRFLISISRGCSRSADRRARFAFLSYCLGPKLLVCSSASTLRSHRWLDCCTGQVFD